MYDHDDFLPALLEEHSEYALDPVALLAVERAWYSDYGGMHLLAPSWAVEALLTEPWLAEELSRKLETFGHFGRREPANGDAVAEGIRRLRELGVLRTFVADERNAVITHAVSQAFPSNDEAGEFLRRYTHDVLAFALQNKIALALKSRALINRLRERLAVLELPVRADRTVERKQELLQRLLPKRGAKAGKWFVGAVMSIAGLDPRIGPAATIAGIVLVVVDP